MNKKAFTLLELLVVVLIIGILAGIALPQYRKVVAKTELAQLLSVIKSFTTSLQSYYLANNTYPQSETDRIKLLDIELNDQNTKCSVTGGSNNTTYLICSNKNFAAWVYVSPQRVIISEIGTNSTKENYALSYACKDLFGKGLRSCSEDSGKSSTCYALGRKNTGCFICEGNKRI